MTPEQFTYWLQGFVEVDNAMTPNKDLPVEQWQVIKDHLKTVFHKVTPPYNFEPTPIPNKYFPPINLPNDHNQTIC